MLDNRFADPLGHRRPAGDGNAVIFALLGDDVDQIVIAEHTGKLQQRTRHFNVIIGQFDHHGAGRPLERRKQRRNMNPRFDFDQLGQLAQHFIVLGNLVVITTIRHKAEQLRHVAEQMVTFGAIVFSIQDTKTGECLLALVKFMHRYSSRFPRWVIVPRVTESCSCALKVAGRN